MSPSDGYQGEMDDLRNLTDRELELLLGGHAPDPELEPLAALLGELSTAFTVPVDEELARRHVAQAAEVARLAPQPATEPVAQPVSGIRRIRRRFATMLSTLSTSLALKIATASVAAAAVAGAGAAATGNLPGDIQTTVSEAVAHVGIVIPTGDEIDTAQLQDDGFQTGGEQAKTNADDEASEVVGEVFGTEDDPNSPQDVSGDSLSDTATDDNVDDPTSLDGDPTGNASNAGDRP